MSRHEREVDRSKVHVVARKFRNYIANLPENYDAILAEDQAFLKIYNDFFDQLKSQMKLRYEGADYSKNKKELNSFDELLRHFMRFPTNKLITTSHKQERKTVHDHLFECAESIMKMAAMTAEEYQEMQAQDLPTKQTLERAKQEIVSRVKKAYSGAKYQQTIWQEIMSRFQDWGREYDRFRCRAVFEKKADAEKFQKKLIKEGLPVCLDSKEKDGRLHWQPFVMLKDLIQVFPDLKAAVVRMHVK